MKLLLRIIKKDLGFVGFIIMLGILNSVLFSLLIIIINNRVQGKPPFIGSIQDEWLLFFAVMGLSFICRKWFQYQMIRFTNIMLFDFELSILGKIKESDYEQFSGIENASVYTAIGDIKIISQVPRYFVDMVNYTILVIICFGYLCFISPLSGAMVILCAGVLAYYYAVRNRYVIGLLRRSRELESQFYEYLDDFLDGFKYWKLSSPKAHSIFTGHITANRNHAKAAEIEASVRYTNNELLGSFGWLIILGVPVFILPMFNPSTAGLAGSITIVILYLMGPVNALITAIPFFSRIRVSLDRIEKFSARIGNLRDRIPEDAAIAQAHCFSNISFNNVRYAYKSGEGQGFALGPVSLQVNRGELIFITGDNGSGKSTFLMLLSGLLSPTEGRISMDGETIGAGNAILLRNQISAVYVDGYLFKKNYDQVKHEEDDANFQRYLQLVRLEKFGLRNTSDRSTQLSKGQQKRLALVQALMEEKDILVLDEWAAEQDPSFRKYFYTVLLPQMQSMGKTIIAVTHDDRYFPLANRVFHFQQGKLVDVPSDILMMQ
jgi:cyclic peptide transporter